VTGGDLINQMNSTHAINGEEESKKRTKEEEEKALASDTLDDTKNITF